MTKQNLNVQHRQRLKDRFIKEGLSNFAPHNILELVLFFSIPRKDTNHIAHALMNNFGTISAVLDAPIEELTNIEGIGIHTATLLKLIPELCSEYNLDKHENIKILDTTERLGEYLKSLYVNKNIETAYLLCFDQKVKMVKCKKLSDGAIDYAKISTRELMKEALMANAVSVVLSHNHPNNWAVPSYTDLEATKKIKKELSAFNIVLRDHIIVSGNDFVSMAESNVF